MVSNLREQIQKAVKSKKADKHLLEIYIGHSRPMESVLISDA